MFKKNENKMDKENSDLDKKSYSLEIVYRHTWYKKFYFTFDQINDCCCK